MERKYKNLFPENKREKRVELWDGWFFDGHQIWDDEGCRYIKEDIKLAWLTQHLQHQWRGSTFQIRSLKDELFKKNAMTKTPTICLIYETPDGTIEKTFKLSEI